MFVAESCDITVVTRGFQQEAGSWIQEKVKFPHMTGNPPGQRARPGTPR